MKIAIGTVLFKPMKKLDGQYIGTKFFVLLVPLFPIESYFITGYDSGVELGLYWKHVLKSYIMFYGTIAVLFFFLQITLETPLAESIPSNYNGIGFLLSSVVFIYGMTFLSKMSEEEKAMRNLYQQTSGINAIPEYFDKESAKIVLRQFEHQFKFQERITWQEALKDENLNPNHIARLFNILGYYRRIHPKSAYEQDYLDILQFFRSLPES